MSIPDKAVEAVAAKLHPQLWDRVTGNRHAESAREDARAYIRAVLEAAEPYLTGGDGGLRQALEELTAGREGTKSDHPNDYFVAPYELRELLAAHPEVES